MHPTGTSFALQVNYADVREDVILLQALSDVSRDDGFYIDVGANDPMVGSVTKLFYDRGWRGVNIDASPVWYERLVQDRPRDVNVQAAISDVPGELTFFDDPSNGLGTAVESFAERHLSDHGIVTRKITVKTETLQKICEQYAPRDIHFLKVDVEGHEEPVLRSMDFQRFRPWVLCIEATEPLRIEAKTFQDWDRIVVRAGYVLAFADHLNRYYVAREREYLRSRFSPIPDSQVKHGWSLEAKF
jgi:FkbM family methyltransferase